jgi:superfamily I DNA and/or RNA helicase
VKFLSNIFYGNRLTSDAQPIREFENWSELPTKKFPILFIDMPPATKHLFGPTSYRNELEARVVLHYLRMVNTLIVDTNAKYRRQGWTEVLKDDIGIITPYKYQTRLIRDLMLLDSRGFAIEDFEAGSRKAIFLSLTRTDKCPDNAEQVCEVCFNKIDSNVLASSWRLSSYKAHSHHHWKSQAG